MTKPIRKRRHNAPGFKSLVPKRPYTEWDDLMGDYNPYAMYEHPYNMKPESLRLYLYNGKMPNRKMLLSFVECLKNI